MTTKTMTRTELIAYAKKGVRAELTELRARVAQLEGFLRVQQQRVAKKRKQQEARAAGQREWTKAQRAAQGRKMRAYWDKKRKIA